jgi:very-short-patch-repair endonuclease
MNGRRRALRNAMPTAEVILWSYLRRRQVLGKKFRRQVSIKNFVVDFFCFELLLAIEVDGPSHFTRKALLKDKERQEKIEGEGVRFLRFTNSEVYHNIDGVMEVVYQTVAELSMHPPSIST